MIKKRIGALTIGQSPRPDLIAPLQQLLPSYEIIQAGALDGLASKDLPVESKTDYPLVTRMLNGARIMVDEGFIEPKLQQALKRIEAQHVVATLLLCAGTFGSLHTDKPLFKPFTIGCSVLRALNIKSIGLIAPVIEQEGPIQRRWKNEGWEPVVWTGDLGVQDQKFHQRLRRQVRDNGLECILLDYFGHPLEHVVQLQRSIDIPVIDLGYLAMLTFSATL
jgi:protein AroM